MDKTYKPQELEDRWYKTWEDRGYFKPQGKGANIELGSAIGTSNSGRKRF